MTSPTYKLVTLPAPAGFVFERTVQSHGWFDLPPFRWDTGARRLSRVVLLSERRAALVTIEGARGPAAGRSLVVGVHAPGRIGRDEMARAAGQVRRMLRLDEDLDAFYKMAEGVTRPDLKWVRRAGAGRLLRAPTVFEDLVKMICTTNCTWALTRVMISALVERLGVAGPQGSRAFPLPSTMAAAPPRFYRMVVRAGYRGEALRTLARAVDRGELDPDSWADPRRPTPEIRAEILSVRGAGPYVADNMLKLLGRYDGLGIDSWCRRKFASMHRGGKPVSDRAIERFYAPFGGFRGLAFWCDVTSDWFDGNEPESRAKDVLTAPTQPDDGADSRGDRIV